MPDRAHGYVYIFQSTPPVRVATTPDRQRPGNWQISIHATREGGDAADGLRQIVPYQFQSTPPVRVATPDFFRSLVRSSDFNPRHP